MANGSRPTFSLLYELRKIQKERAVQRQVKRRIIPFAEYLALLESGTEHYFTTVHERLYHAIVSRGVNYVSYETNPFLANLYGLEKNKVLPIYSAFEDFVGIADVIDEIVAYFHGPMVLPGTSEAELQALVLIGPTGSGKSRFVDRLIKILEESGPLWRLYGCPHNDHPLSLLPRHLRPLLDDAAEEKAVAALPDSAVKIRRRLKELGIRIESDICPVCRERLLRGWPDIRLPNGEPLPWAKDGFPAGSPIALEDYPVERAEFSKRSNTGYFEVPLTDEDDLDISPLVGKIDIAKIPLYRSESDVRVLTLDGAFNRANQGIIEFPEIFKRPRRPLKILIGATQDKTVPLPGSHGNVSVNVLIIGHSNWEEYNKFRAKGARNEALMRRFVVKYFRYNLSLSEEVRLLESRLNTKKCRKLFDIAPHTMETVAALAVLSRYRNIPEISPIQKLEVLDGKRVIDAKNRELTVKDVRHPEDGLEEAISFREEMKLFERLFYIKRAQSGMLNSDNFVKIKKIPIIPADAFDLLPQMVEEVVRSQSLGEEWKKGVLSYIPLLKDRYNTKLSEELRRILIPNLVELTNAIFLNYIRNCELWYEQQLGNKLSQKADEEFLSWVEKNIEGGVRNVKEFRKSRLQLYWAEKEKSGEVTYQNLGFECARAFEECAFREFMRLVGRVRNVEDATENEKEEYQRLIEAMKSLGYTELTAPLVLDYFLNTNVI